MLTKSHLTKTSRRRLFRGRDRRLCRDFAAAPPPRRRVQHERQRAPRELQRRRRGGSDQCLRAGARAAKLGTTPAARSG